MAKTASSIVSERSLGETTALEQFVPAHKQRGVTVAPNFDEAKRFDSSELDPQIKELFNRLLNP